MVTKFSNQSHTHNLYRWSLQHAIASYSTVMTCKILFTCTPAQYSNYKDDFGDTALVAAVDEGHLHVAEILVKNGADMNYRNKVRAFISVTQVYIMWPIIRHDIMVNQ